MIENNENVNKEYTTLYHIEIFNEKNVIEMTKKNPQFKQHHNSNE